MSVLRSHEASFLVAIATLVAACSSDATVKQLDYAGEAYPNRRASLEPGGRRAGYVANRSSDTISVIDLDELSLIGTAPVGRDPVDIDGPRHVVLDPKAGLAYVALSYPFSDQGAHAASLGVTQRAGYVEALNLSDLSVAGDLRLDPSTSELAFSAATGQLAATHFDVNRATINTDPAAKRATVALIDAPAAIATSEATPRKISLCAVPASLAFNADGSRLYVACVGEDSLVVVDPESGEAVGRVPAGTSPANRPYALVADTARERLLVSNQVSSTVSVFDMADEPNVLASMWVPGMPMFGTWLSDSTIAVPYQQPSGVAVYDLETTEQRLDVSYPADQCDRPAELTLTRDGRLFLICEGTHYTPGAIVELDPETLAVQARLELGLYPERLTIWEP